jgi:SOS-response transcriptional repressor LexA
MYKSWVKAGVHKPGKSVIGLAKALSSHRGKNVHRGTIYKIIAGTREIHLDELAPIAKYIEEPIPMPQQTAIVSGELITVPIEREVGVGMWLEAGVTHGSDLGVITTPRDHIHPHAQHHAYLFRGDSMVHCGIIDGDVLICIKPHAEAEIDGCQVIVERNRSGVIEVSVRMAEVFKDRVEFKACCDNDTYKPIVVKHKGKQIEAVNVLAIVRRVTRTVK